MLQLRVEATNVLNHVNLSNPGTNLNTSATFGKIRSADEMRRIQLGARLSFWRRCTSSRRGTPDLTELFAVE